MGTVMDNGNRPEQRIATIVTTSNVKQNTK